MVNKLNENSAAFTLLELMIVIAIIAFLASIALPKYSKYMARAKQAEVALNLASLHAAEQMYFAQNGKYTTILSGEGSLGWEPSGYNKEGNHNFYYTYGFLSSAGQDGKGYFIGKLKTSPDNLKSTFANNDKFIAAAAATLVDGKVDIWTIDENRNLVNSQNGID